MFKNIKKELLISLIVTLVILVFINPILEFLWVLLKNIYGDYIDKMYYDASFGIGNKFDFQIFTIILLSLVFGLTMFLIFSFIRFDSQMERKKVKAMIETGEAVDEYLEEKISRLKNQLNYIEKLLRVLSKPMKYIIIPSMYILALLIVFESYTDLTLNNSFNRRVAALGPYITSVEEKMLRSKWAMMESRHDFELIDAYMESAAMKKHIKLPKNILK